MGLCSFLVSCIKVIALTLSVDFMTHQQILLKLENPGFLGSNFSLGRRSWTWPSSHQSRVGVWLIWIYLGSQDQEKRPKDPGLAAASGGPISILIMKCPQLRFSVTVHLTPWRTVPRAVTSDVKNQAGVSMVAQDTSLTSCSLGMEMPHFMSPPE